MERIHMTADMVALHGTCRGSMPLAMHTLQASRYCLPFSLVANYCTAETLRAQPINVNLHSVAARLKVCHRLLPRPPGLCLADEGLQVHSCHLHVSGCQTGHVHPNMQHISVWSSSTWRAKPGEQQQRCRPGKLWAAWSPA